MESRGNDERVKFVDPTISVRWREKTCGPGIYVNDHITLNFSNYLHSPFFTFFEPNVPLVILFSHFRHVTTINIIDLSTRRLNSNATYAISKFITFFTNVIIQHHDAPNGESSNSTKC